ESYFNYKRGEYTYKERMRLLKKKSCPGCENCGPTLEMLDEDVAEDNFPIIDKIKHGALYTLQVVNITRDWESGTIDGWDHAFVEIEEEKKKDGE
ncbi:MAG: hypothetical protein KAR06_00495, partial [Deltaproteobacteria bacterium]|nr:hypothetical protein [Deltaproteobacteria bacterium]